jgi:hypothetical protein
MTAGSPRAEEDMQRAFGLALALIALHTGAGAAEPSWLHVQVVEGKPDGAKVNVNLPLSLVDVALEAVQDKDLRGGRIRLGRGREDLDLGRLRRMWVELKKAGDTEFVSVEEKDESVRVERKGERVFVRVTDKRSGRDKVRVDVPTSVVDALFSGEGDELNLRAAIAELTRTTNGEFIHVDDGDAKVRIWID